MNALDAALTYAARGWPVFPCKPGQKTPATPHGVLDATTSEPTIRAWWAATPGANIGIATGAPGPDVLDVDTDDETGLAALATLTQAGLLDNRGPTVRTRSGGWHVYFTGTTQRSSTLRSKTGPSACVDFKAAGGYVIAPPSFAEADDRGPAGHYELISPGTEHPTATDWDIIKHVVLPPPAFQQPHREPPGRQDEGGELRAGDDYNQRTDWADILIPRGWALTATLRDGTRYWRRPGKQHGMSATTGRPPHDNLYVFSTSTEFATEVPHTKFHAYAVLEHGGDHAAARRALQLTGYGPPAQAITVTPPPPAPGQENAQDATERTSWHPRDLGPVLDGEESGDPKPVLLHRDDGACLLYRAKINALIGESESGKTWIALLAATQAIRDGAQVLYLDFEDAPAGITGRLRALGLTRAQLAAHFRYIAPDEPLTGPAAADLSTALATPTPDLIILDGVNAAMTMLGLNLKDNKDATDFSQRILRPLKRTGAAVLTVDHVTKDREGRGNYAIGAQAKRADIDGAAFLIEVVKPFGRGLTGKLRMTVSKDRPGHVRAVSADARNAGTAILASRAGGGIDAVIEKPDMRPVAERPAWRPTGIMERVSRFLELCPDGATGHSVEKEVTGKGAHIREALTRLTEDGCITRELAPRNGSVYRSAKPYREISEQQIPTSSRPRPDLVPSPGTRSSAGPADFVPRTPCVTSSQGGRDEVGRTGAQDELAGLNSSPSPSSPAPAVAP